MKTAKFSAREINLARELRKYENKWVAIVVDGKHEKVVASGDRIIDAKAVADKSGERSIPKRFDTTINSSANWSKKGI